MSKAFRGFLAIFACAAVSAVGRAAAAAPTTPAPTARDNPEVEAAPSRHWYGWQTLTVDGASFASLGTGAVLFSAQGSRETLPPQILLWSGLAGSTLGAPIVHFSHGKLGRGFGSLGLRLSGLLVFALAFPEGGGSDSGGAAALGLGLFGSAIVLDATAFDDNEARRGSVARWSLSPMLGTRRGLIFGYRL